MSAIAELQEAEKELHKHEQDIISEWDKPLKVDENGYIVSGVLWIPGPFKQDFWSKARVKPKPAKCFCPECGKSHTRKGA